MTTEEEPKYTAKPSGANRRVSGKANQHRVAEEEALAKGMAKKVAKRGKGSGSLRQGLIMEAVCGSKNL